MARTQLSRTPLSKHAGVLRTSLLLSLGLSPLACGGSVVTRSTADGGSSAQAGSAGTTSYAGAGAYGGWGPVIAGGAGPVIAGGAGPRGGAGPTTDTCPNPVFDSSTQLTTCSNGLKHRPEAMTCTYLMPPPPNGGTAGSAGAAGSADGGTGGVTYCDTNADCSALIRGYCDINPGIRASCKSGCFADSDCVTGGVCACDGINPGRCTYPGGCRVDADCGPGSFCAPANSPCGGTSFECTSPKDECITDDDCRANNRGTCSTDGGYRACNNATCGRPFLIADAPRLAGIETRADWLDATLSPDVSGLSPLQRAQLAAHWARLGQMEHASIAAFARFNLQLLSLAAPSDLVEACNRALADETAHARACFALASAYGGTAVGPARLDIEHCFEDTSLVAIAKLVLREGCLGETVASLEALAAAEVTSDPAVKCALTRIARDELSHAELAFKFLRWALTQSSEDERHQLASEAAQQLADFESDARNGECARTDDRLAAHGLIASDALHAIHLAAARDVTRPLLAALFDVQSSSDA